MTRIVRGGDLIGLPVVTLSDARIVGEVRDVLFDPADSRVAGFTLRGRGLLSPPLIGLLPMSAVESVGNDALMISSEDAVLREREQYEQQIADKKEAPGAEVVTEDGVALGLVSDIVLEVSDAQLSVVGYCVERSNGREWVVPAPPGTREWSEQIVVPRGIEREATEGLASFSVQLQRNRQPRSGLGL